MATKRTVTVGGKTVDFDKLEDLTQLQAQLLPGNWPISKKDGVRLYLSMQEILSFEFKRHLAHNFKKILKVALEQKEDGEGPTVVVNFGAELNFTALTVAAFSKQKMSFSQKFSSDGKPKSIDINQDELPLDDGIDPAALDEENAAAEQAEAAEKEKAQAERDAKTAGEEQGHAKKGKKSGKKKPKTE